MPYACVMQSQPEHPQEIRQGYSPLCFVLMPFGVKSDGDGRSVDFDAVYAELLAPAIREAGLEPLRADQELTGGLIHKPMFERLILSDYAVADLTTANANVFYELGVRHAVRPYSTVLVSARGRHAPFDLAPDRVWPYSLDPNGRPAELSADRAALASSLHAARAAVTDSPVFQLIDDLPTPQIDRLKTDVFREQAAYSAQVRDRLRSARADGVEALRAIERELGPLEDVEAGVLVDLLLSYRATKAWGDMTRLVEAMPEPVSRAVLVQEQYGFGLNRDGRSEDAEQAILRVLEEHGPSSETYGLLGRIYKDRWESERETSPLRAAGDMDRAIDAYRRGFEADLRDAYPGVVVRAGQCVCFRPARPGDEQRSAQRQLGPKSRERSFGAMEEGDVAIAPVGDCLPERAAKAQAELHDRAHRERRQRRAFRRRERGIEERDSRL